MSACLIGRWASTLLESGIKVVCPGKGPEGKVKATAPKTAIPNDLFLSMEILQNNYRQETGPFEKTPFSAG